MHMDTRKWTLACAKQPHDYTEMVPNMDNLELDFHKLPLWFYLHNVPLDLFHGVGLSHIASAIGIPLYMDSTTASTSRLSFTKVCIEVTADSIAPTEIDVVLADGSMATVGVTIPWRPFVCNRCKIFGHTDSTCTKQSADAKQIWKEKGKEAAHVFDESSSAAIRSEHAQDSAASHEPFADALGPGAQIPADAPEPGAQAKPVIEASHDIIPAQEPFPANLGQSSAVIILKPSEGTDPPPIKDPTIFPELGSTIKGNKGKKASPSSSAKGKSTLTSSANKFMVLREDEDEPEELREYDDVNAQEWKNIIENATFTPVKTIAAAKELDKAYANMHEKNKQIVARGGKRQSVATSPPGRRR